MSQIRHSGPAPTTSESRAGGEVIGRHSHDEHQLVYVSTGVLAISTEDGSWVASRDRAVWVPAGLWHEHRFYGPSSFHTLGFVTREAPLPDQCPTVVGVSGLVRELLVAATDPRLPAGETRRIRSVLRDQIRRASVRPLSLPTADDPRLAAACRTVQSDLGHPRNITWLARSVGTSERTLSRLFRGEFGMTYPQWRTNARVFHSMVLLSQGVSVTETAYRCGWSTSSAFIETFAQVMSITPGTYRQQG